MQLSIKPRKQLVAMGERIRLARLRRKLSVKLVCERAGISRSTLWHIEKGDPSVSIGAYAAVLHALSGMDEDFSLILKNDPCGHILQETELFNKYKRN